MPTDHKFGRVTLEHQRSVGDDEPVFVLRAKDMYTLSAIRHYRSVCELGGVPRHHLDIVSEAMAEIEEWQKANGARAPRSDSMAAERTSRSNDLAPGLAGWDPGSA